MPFCDFHIHSRLSLDGESLLIDQVRASREQGVRCRIIEAVIARVEEDGQKNKQ